MSTSAVGHVEAPEKEIECLALNVYWEARNQPVQGQFAIALVTMNRVASRNFPNMVCAVVWQKGPQFSWTLDGKSDRPLERDAWNRANWVAMLVYRDLVPDFTQGAMFYHSTTVLPWWAPSYIYAGTIGNHIFYRKSEGG